MDVWPCKCLHKRCFFLFFFTSLKCVSHVAAHRRSTLQPSVYTGETKAATDNYCAIHPSVSSAQILHID